MFSSARKLTVGGPKALARSIINRSRASMKVCVRSMVTMQEKEQGEEARYFRKQDELAKAELKAKLDKLLESDDESKKEEIAAILEPKESKSIFSDPAVMLPLGIVGSYILLSHEIIQLDTETHLAGAFMLVVGTAYYHGRDILDKYQKDTTAQQLANYKQIDDAALQDLIEVKEATEQVIDIDQEISEINNLLDNLHIAEADILNAKERVHFRDQIQRKLDSIVSLENAAVSAISARMITDVKQTVLTTFTKDKAAKDKALEQAIAVLSAGNGAKFGKDVVGDEFVSALKKYRDGYAKVSPDADALLVKLNKDVKAVIDAPLSLSKGGNVYETHPIHV